MPIKIEISVVHNDENGEDGPIAIDASAGGACCKHELAIYLSIKKHLDELAEREAKNLPLLDEALTEMVMHGMKTGNPLKRRRDQ